jgi:hypothetical protein
MLATPKQASAVMGPTEGQVRALMRKGLIAHVHVGRRLMIPRDAIERFIQENTVQPCRDETPVPVSASSKKEGAFTSAGPKLAAAGSVARVLQIADKLKSSSPSSCVSERAPADRVIPLKF